MKNRAFVLLVVIIALCTACSVAVCADTQIDKADLYGNFSPSVGDAPTLPHSSEGAPYTVSGWYSEYDLTAGEYVAVSGPFEAGHTYYLNIILTAADGYDFSLEGTELYVNGSYHSTLDYSESGVSCMFVFEIGQYIREVSITGVGNIAAGEYCDAQSIGTEQDSVCSASGQWSVYDAEAGGYVAFDGVFESAREYRLTLKLRAQSPWVIDPSSLVVYVGGEAYFDFYISGENVCLDIIYQLSSVIGRVDVMGVAEPVVGNAADTSGICVVEGAKYSISSCSWIVYDSGYVSFCGTFASGGVYYLEIMLTCGQGYSFGDTVELYINGKYHSDISTTAQSVYIYEEYKLPEVVSSVLLTGSVDPKVGAQVSNYTVRASSSAKYTVSSRWVEYTADLGPAFVNDGSFGAGGIYELHITVLPKEGVCFSPSAKVRIGLRTVTASVTPEAIRIVLFKPLADVLDSVGIGGISEPVAGMTAVSDGIEPNTAKYRLVRAEWKKYDEQSGEYFDFDGHFERGEKYALCFELVCEFGYAFSSDAAVLADGTEAAFEIADHTRLTGVCIYTLTEAELMPGDTDTDGQLTNSDITLLVRYLCGYFPLMSVYNADFDENSQVNNRDAVLLIRRLALCDEGE